MNKEIMKKFGFGKEVDLVENKQCPMCCNKIDEKDFKDEISKKEYKISGLCQKCQDKFFN